MFLVIHIISIVLWGTLTAWLSGSMWRSLSGRATGLDNLWAWVFLVSFWITLFRVRMFVGLAPANVTHEQIISNIGMHTLGALIALAGMWKRYKREGFRW